MAEEKKDTKNKLKKGIQKISEEQLHISKHGGWLTSRFHFAFSEWYDGPSAFGCLRVMNDDLVTPKNGFGRHPHRHMEIFSYILEGQLTHGDSMHNSETLSRGAVQYMSAGDGVYHSELNNNKTETCRFIQTWIVPDSSTYKDEKVRYGSRSFERTDRLNKLLHVIAPQEKEDGGEDSKKGIIQFRRDCNVFVSELEEGRAVEFSLKEGRQAYLLCAEGAMTVNDESLKMREACKIFGPLDIKITATHKSSENMFINQTSKGSATEEKLIYPSAHLMLIEMKQESKE